MNEERMIATRVMQLECHGRNLTVGTMNLFENPEHNGKIMPTLPLDLKFACSVPAKDDGF
jgi:hypothetical protein